MIFHIDRYIALVLIATCVVALALSVATLNQYLIAGVATIALAMLLIHKTWNIIEAKVFEKTNLVQLFNGFELSGSRTAILARANNRYTATAAARVTTLGHVEVDRDKVENLVGHVNAPFKLVLQVERLDTSRLLERMQTKRGMKEIALSRIEKPGSGKGLLASGKLHGEIAHLEHEIESIRGGGVPLKLAYYVMTSAGSESRYRAEEEAKLQIRELVSEFDAAFGTKSSILSGEDVLKMMRFDSAVA